MIIDNEIGEIKECSSITSVDSQLRSAMHQNARVVCLDITTKINMELIRKAIEHRKKRTKNSVKNIFILMNGMITKL